MNADWSRIRLCETCGAGNPIDCRKCIKCGSKALGKAAGPFDAEEEYRKIMEKYHEMKSRKRPVDAETRAAWPRTVDQAVAMLLDGMEEPDKEFIRSTPREKLTNVFHLWWGMGIRNDFGLWAGNDTLLADCRTDLADDASMVIIEAVWRKLQSERGDAGEGRSK